MFKLFIALLSCVAVHMLNVEGLDDYNGNMYSGSAESGSSSEEQSSTIAFAPQDFNYQFSIVLSLDPSQILELQSLLVNADLWALRDDNIAISEIPAPAEGKTNVVIPVRDKDESDMVYQLLSTKHWHAVLYNHTDVSFVHFWNEAVQAMENQFQALNKKD